MILADNETKIDLLNNEAIAAAIIKLLCERPDQPVTGLACIATGVQVNQASWR